MSPAWIKAELRPMLHLAWPIILAEIGWMLMGIVDTIMVGRLPQSAEAIAAVSLGTILFFTVGIFGAGLFLGLDTVVSQAIGAGDPDDAHRWLINSLYMTLPLAVAFMSVLWGVEPLLARLGENPDVLRFTLPYLDALNWSMFPLLIYFAFRRYLQSINAVRPVMFALLTANLVNWGANWVLIYGKLGFPAMGVAGSGWSTVLARVYMALVLIGAAIRNEPAGRRWITPPSVYRIRRLLALGLPVGLQIGLELLVFAIAAALIGRLDAASLAAHQIALNAAAFTYMIPLGISSAAAVRVGQALGRKDPHGAATAGWTALALGIGFMCFAAIVLWTFPRQLTRLYTTDPAVIRLSVSLLAIAAVFQIFDGCQVVASGALRGAGDTRTPMFCHLAGYWGIGIPLGYIACYRWGWGAVGVWTGLCAGLVSIGAVLFTIWSRQAHAWALEPLRNSSSSK